MSRQRRNVVCTACGRRGRVSDPTNTGGRPPCCGVWADAAAAARCAACGGPVTLEGPRQPRIPRPATTPRIDRDLKAP